ncbi:conserved exported protein of unknown function [Georgfuchsia toluolica]|uniref:Outer membrane cytochrome MtrC/MtrF-like domain-containing protein n=1 Tax=Georgfuchsia toluolica TaxID=424218 RepID=A0A916J2S0_9PROT|nr:OmcA/MtrC family decaheme c-type cytochrome [Georgfuchsia toluolica]CAG4883522.1 conserved exported protein of unknown function [Georgfuchsia toluolica]
MKITALARLGLITLMVGTLAACSGDNGSDGSPGATGAQGPAGPAGPPGKDAGTGPVTLASNSAPVTEAATAAWAALAPQVTVQSVTIASPPVVNFTVITAAGNPVVGLGNTSQSATATVPGYANLSFALAKLVPGTGTAPSRWVSYIVTTVPTKNATTGAITASVPTRPTTDNTGTLVDHGDGTYTYTFYRDITKAKDDVAAATLTAPNVAADLDDLTFDPTLVHRVSIQLSGNAPGTGTNTPNAVQVTPGVLLANPANAIYDFTPATGAAVTASGRDIASTQKCNDCHQNLGGFPTASAEASDATFHGGNRNKVEYCVVCHTEQRKYGRTEAVVLADGNYDGLSTYRINGLAVGKLAPHIHKIHMSEFLLKAGYNYGGVRYEEACKFPQDIRNCTKCHDGTAGAASATAQGDNWKNVPNRSACGACHDGINFATGGGETLNGAFPGHVGGAKADDSQCALCHDATTIAVNHIPVTPPNPTNSLLLGGTNSNTNAAWIASNTSNVPAGAIKVTYEINSVSKNASNQPVMVFRMLQNGVATPFNTFATATPNPATGQKEIWDNFMGAPSVYFVFAVPQDGIAAPADFNASVSSYLRSLWNGTATGTGAGTLTGPDANGFYTATLTGITIPASAVMLTGGMGYSYNVKSTLPLTQTNLSNYPVTAATGSGLTAGMPNATGGLIVVAPDQQKVASGYTGRRAIVEDARCNKCHQELGVFTEDNFHAGQRNDGTTCSWCHNPNRTSSGWSADSTSFVHAIHAAAKRGMDFTWHASSTTDGFWKIGYPGILNKCETCHLPGTYDFSAAASAGALPNRLYRTVATGIFSSTASALSLFAFSPYITLDTDYGSGFSYNAGTQVITAAAGTTLVNSPIATACFACHDSTVAQAHMRANGGSLYAGRTAALATTEQCTICHLSGQIADIKAMHAK